MSIFPFIESKPIETKNKSLPMYKEVAWNFESNTPIIENGSFKIVEGIEAIKTWVFKTLNTERFKYIIYSWDYGHELDTLIGKAFSPSFSSAEAHRYIKEALSVNEYIKEVNIIDSKLKEGKLLKLTIKLDTIYGKTEVKV